MQNEVDSIQMSWEEQNQLDKDRFLHELYLYQCDDVTNDLVKMMKKIPVDKESDISFFKLLEIEQKFRSVIKMHRSEYKYDEILCDIADNGIESAQALCDKMNDNDNNKIAELYLFSRIAGFYFYKGYCHLGKDRLEDLKMQLAFI